MTKRDIILRRPATESREPDQTDRDHVTHVIADGLESMEQFAPDQQIPQDVAALGRLEMSIRRRSNEGAFEWARRTSLVMQSCGLRCALIPRCPSMQARYRLMAEPGSLLDRRGAWAEALITGLRWQRFHNTFLECPTTQESVIYVNATNSVLVANDLAPGHDFLGPLSPMTYGMYVRGLSRWVWYRPLAEDLSSTHTEQGE